jgi:hypothetical protein
MYGPINKKPGGVDGRDKPGHDGVDESAQGAAGMTRDCAVIFATLLQGWRAVIDENERCAFAAAP